MRDLEDRLKELGDRISRQAPSELRPTAHALRRIRVGRAVRSGTVLATAAALVIGGFAAARSLNRDEALPPAKDDSNVSPFVDTWTNADVDGGTSTMTIRASGENVYEITMHDDLFEQSYFQPNENGKYVQVVNDVCSGSPATLTGTGQAFGSKLVIPSPEITCDDGSDPKGADDLPPYEELLRDLTFVHDPESDILTDYSSSDGNALALVWGRAEAENRMGDVSGWITYGDKGEIWARDLTSPADPSDRALLSSTPGTPKAWSPDGSKLLVLGDDGRLFLLNSDGTETRVTDANAGVNGASFSPDGSQVVYATSGAIYMVDADGRGDSRPVYSNDGCCEDPTFSPDGKSIAYFEGGGDHSNVLRVINADGSGSRILVDREFGHIYGLQWSPDGSRLIFASGAIWVVGADGTGLEQVTSEIDGTDPHWSPDGSHIAYTRTDPQTSEGRSIEIVRLEDLKVQNFGEGESGPWTSEVAVRPQS